MGRRKQKEANGPRRRMIRRRIGWQTRSLLLTIAGAAADAERPAAAEGAAMRRWAGNRKFLVCRPIISVILFLIWNI